MNSTVKPCGLEPFDADYGVASSGMLRDPSPYKRINKILRSYELTTNGRLNGDRYKTVTRTFQEMDGQDMQLIWATAFARTLRECAIKIYPDELLVGEISCRFKEAPLFPEMSMDWLVRELKAGTIDHCPERDHDYFAVPDDVKEAVLSTADFWRGRTVEDKVLERLTDEEKKGSDYGKGVFQAAAYIRSSAGHTSPQFDMILSHGFGALKERVRGLRAKLDENDTEKKTFYDAELIALDGASDYIRRFASLAEKMAADETDETRASELRRIAANCYQVAEGTPRDFWEALQLYYFSILLAQIEANGQAVCYGRFDQIFYPFYKSSIESGALTKQQIQELIESLYLKIFHLNKVRDKESVAIFANGGVGPCMTVGGVDKAGNDATNDLTFMCLDAHVHTRIITPWLAVRMHSGTPHELKVKVASVIRIGTGEPKIFNDNVTIPMLVKFGRTLEDARNYQVVGCVEPDVTGFEYGWHDAAYFSIAKVLELAINDGHCMECGPSCPRWKICGGAGKQLGLKTGSLADFTSFDQVIDAYDRQMAYWTDRLVAMLNKIDQVHGEVRPQPYLSSVMEDCTVNGKDVTRGGARYNYIGPQGVGMGTVADGLSAIKQLVFEEKKVSGAELLAAAKANWEGYEPLYALVNSSKVHHYGNDDDYADSLAKIGMDTYCRHINGRDAYRGGKFAAGVYSVSINVAFGMTQWASVDGRKAWEPVSDCMGPVHDASGSHDIKGPTAILRSVTKLDHSQAGNGTLLNWKFTPGCLAGDAGRDNLVALIDEYVARGGMHSQFTVVDASTLKAAQKNPEDYKGLMVRIAGYSAYFVELSPALQNDIIGRTSLAF